MNRIILKGVKRTNLTLEVLGSPERFPKGLEKIRNSREEELKFLEFRVWGRAFWKFCGRVWIWCRSK